jgi:hypothetical protein
MEEEIEKRCKFTESRRINGQKGGRPTQKHMDNHMDNHMGNDNDNDNTNRFIPPTIDEVTVYCRERGKGVDADKWHNFYASKGWMVGKNKMKDWKAAVRTWEVKKAGDKPSGSGKFAKYTGTVL